MEKQLPVKSFLKLFRERGRRRVRNKEGTLPGRAFVLVLLFVLDIDLFKIGTICG
jgi:hypothetical protein